MISKSCRFLEQFEQDHAKNQRESRALSVQRYRKTLSPDFGKAEPVLGRGQTTTSLADLQLGFRLVDIADMIRVPMIAYRYIYAFANFGNNSVNRFS
jgi:hypothetical protein